MFRYPHSSILASNCIFNLVIYHCILSQIDETANEAVLLPLEHIVSRRYLNRYSI